MRKRTVLFIVLFGLTGCFSHRPTEIDASYLDWSGFCFEDYRKKAEKMAAGPYRGELVISSTGALGW